MRFNGQTTIERTDLKSDDFSWFGWDNGKLVNKHRARSLDRSVNAFRIEQASAVPRQNDGRSTSHVSIQPIDVAFSWQKLGNDDDAFATWDVRFSRQWFNIEKKGWDHEKTFNLEIVDGIRALGFRMEATSGKTPRGSDMDKFLIQMHSRWTTPSGRHPFGEKRYYGFKFYLPADFRPPITGTKLLLWQIKQGAPFAPGCNVQLDGECRLRVAVLNDRTGSMPNSRQDVVYLSDPIERNVWHHVILMVVPRHLSTVLEIDHLAHCKCVPMENQPGEVTVWLNDMAEPVAHRRIHIGFDPSCFGAHRAALPANCRNSAPAAQSKPDGVHPNSRMETMIGLYRTR